jgi:hypothetical protein
MNIPFKGGRKRPKTVAESDERIDQMVDTMLVLMGDLKRDADRIEATLKQTRQVGRQYVRLMNPEEDSEK